MLVALRMTRRLAAIATGMCLLDCGARSAISSGDGAGPLVACNQDSDCFEGNLCTRKVCEEGFCKTIWNKTCNDGDVCTADVCDPSSGSCVFSSRVADNDGDGYLGALPGMQPGTLGSCGDDCDDSNPAVHLGATELCDGVDNNCNGVIDEGVNAYSPYGAPIRISDGTFTLGGANGLAYANGIFGITWTGQQSGKGYQGYLSGFDIYGSSRISTTNTSRTSNDSFAGPLVWNGTTFATAWEVRGARGYDIYFNQLDISGKKIGPDIRVSNNVGFSVQPSLLWDSVNYWLVWSDDNGGDLFRIYGRKVDKNNQLVGDGLALTNLADDARSPIIVRSPTSYLLIYLSASNQRLYSRTVASDMTPGGTAISLSDSGANTFAADWVNDRFVVAWSVENASLGNAIYAATLDANGNTLQRTQQLTFGANFARAPNLISLGDRFALAWADDRLTYGHYGVRLGTFSANLVSLGPVSTLVETAYDCIDPGLAGGGQGMALVYRERTYGDVGQPFFLPLTCAPGH
jgi:hypothetical protein